MPQEQPNRVERRLLAILAADVAGYSRLMHSDEEPTHAKLTALLMDVVNPAIAEHGGRIVKNTGTGSWRSFRVRSRRFGLQRNSRSACMTSRLAMPKISVSPFAL